ncbi:UDP-N-acetylmuramate--L-alanine ligase [bacterium]|jgi:UDP-N-acetylmuramate--alanine ligase|nr:UDP-N-acetylmuramate--L-alanine ligase [bacterium]
MYRKKTHVHFVGIGGIGMSGIATILHYQGYPVSGCDLDLEQQSIKNLKKLGVPIAHGHNTKACQDESIDVVVYSSAVKPTSPEIINAQARGIPTIPRALMLAELMRTKFSIAIAGSHGKTTTTSMASHILIESKTDPTVIIGGHLKNISSNARLGKGDFLVAEADESDRSLLNLQATLAVVTNIDLEHLETYKDLDDVKDTFKQFLNNLPFYGKAILCADDPHIKSLLPMPHIKTVKYGIESNLADLKAQNIKLMPDHSTFDVILKDKELGSCYLNMPGKHNVLNSLAATAVSLELGIAFSTIAKALKSFKGIERRFMLKGTYKGTKIFDDYGHHPKEIEQTLIVAKKCTTKDLVVVFQPHRYTRTNKLWSEFISMFLNSGIDHLIVTDIYPASEDPIEGITSENFVRAFEKFKPNFSVSYVPYESDFSSIRKNLSNKLQDGNLLLLQGAGKVNNLADILNNETP